MTKKTTISTDIITPFGHIKRVPCVSIDPNPWQPRVAEDDHHIAGIAESIREHGLMQIPTARPHPEQLGRYQLAFGHTRLAAFKALHASYDDACWATFPLNIVMLDDRQLANWAAQENVQRKDLSAIETARAIQRYMADFGVGQLEAARQYGYSAQSSVSNLLRLLDLPEAVQMLVHAGQLPERIARMLLQVARYSADDCTRIANDLASKNANNENADEIRFNLDSICRNLIDEWLRKKGKDLSTAIWEMAWPKKPMQVPADIKEQAKDQFGAIQACAGCDFHVASPYGAGRCMNHACFKAKGLMKAHADVKTACAHTGVPAAAVGEKVKIIYQGEYGYSSKDGAEALVTKLIGLQHESLRIVPFTTKDWGGDRRKKLLGAVNVALATVDPKAIEQIAPPKPNREQVDWEEQSRIRNERVTRNRVIQRTVAPAFAKALPSSPPMLKLLSRALPLDYWIDGYQEPKKFQAEFDQADLATQQAIIAGMLLWNVEEDDRDPESYVGFINSLQGELKVKLPSTWAKDALDSELPPEDQRPWEARYTDDEDDVDDYNEVVEDELETA